MYRLLIVDDEQHVADWLYELFKDFKQVEFDVYKAYSAISALEIMSRSKIDIIITDISMPKMNGLQLVDRIKEEWPECRVIFLTGYDEFEYAQKAIRSDAVGYVLKTEEDAQVIKAVEKAVRQIDDGRKLSYVAEKAKQQIKTAQQLLQREFMAEILEDGYINQDELQNQLDELEIPLKANAPLLLLVGRLDNKSGLVSYVERRKLLFGIEVICSRFLSVFVACFFFVTDNNDMLWFLQPAALDCSAAEQVKGDSYEKTVLFVRDTLDTIQKACKETLKETISFIFGTEPVPWGKAACKQLELKDLINRNTGLGDEMLMTDKSFKTVENQCVTDDETMDIQFKKSKPGTLSISSEKGSKNEFNVASIAVSRVMKFICSNLSEDLSLLKLADIVYFNPSYLSRLFKQITGSTLTDYIYQMRVEKAKLLLEDCSLKIHEVASAVGYDSSTYFARFFKKMTGINPQEYREMIFKK